MTSQTAIGSQPTSAGHNDIILRTIGLTKHFGKLEAVKNLNLELRRGEVFGFLGPNGAVAPRPPYDYKQKEKTADACEINIFRKGMSKLSDEHHIDEVIIF